MTPRDDDGRPRHRTGPNVENLITTDDIILARELRRRREAANRCQPMADGRRDPLDKRRSA